MIVLADVSELKDPIIDQLFVHARGFSPVVFIADEIAKLLFGQGKQLSPDCLIERYSMGSNAASVAQTEPPEVDSFPFLCPHANTNGEEFFYIGFFKFQVEIAGGFLTLSVSKKVEVHFSVSGAKRIQPLGASIAIQKKGDKTLCGDGFSRGIVAPQQDVSILD